MFDRHQLICYSVDSGQKIHRERTRRVTTLCPVVQGNVDIFDLLILEQAHGGLPAPHQMITDALHQRPLFASCRGQLNQGLKQLLE